MFISLSVDNDDRDDVDDRRDGDGEGTRKKFCDWFSSLSIFKEFCLKGSDRNIMRFCN